MDLKQVISELRAELESIDQVTAALERLAELRSRRSPTLSITEAELPVRRSRTRKSSNREGTASASASGE